MQRFHNGIDLFAPAGTAVYATEGGTVQYIIADFYAGTSAVMVRAAGCGSRRRVDKEGAVCDPQLGLGFVRVEPHMPGQNSSALPLTPRHTQIKHDSGKVILYGEVDRAVLKRVGDRVEAGTQIGKVGWQSG